MPDTIPFTPSTNNVKLGVALGTDRVFFDTRWNDRDNAWYFDLYAEDGSIVLLNVKVVLGVNFGHRSRHPFFSTNDLVAIDTSGRSIDAGYDDLGGRVVILHTSASDVGVTAFR